MDEVTLCWLGQSVLVRVLERQEVLRGGRVARPERCAQFADGAV